jgi:hypothetical protein
MSGSTIILALCDFGHAFRWYYHEIYRTARLPLAPLPKGGGDD